MLEGQFRFTNASASGSKRGSGYAVYDPVGQKIGNAEEVFVDRNEEPQYVRVRIGLFKQKSVLIRFASVDDERRMLVLSNRRLVDPPQFVQS